MNAIEIKELHKNFGAKEAVKGLNLDKIWESLITDLGDITIEEGNSLDEQIAVDEAKARLEKQIADLEKKARSEKQPRKRLEYFEQVKQLRILKEQK